MITPVDKITIWRQDYAPASERYAACWYDYDEGSTVGSGPTPEQAVRDLIDNHDSPESVS